MRIDLRWSGKHITTGGMPVRFVIGRAGTGKSRHCLNAIAESLRADPLGDPVYLIVPKQETFSAERELTCGTALNGFCRARVVSFDLLGQEILSECGGTAIPQVTPVGRQMIIGHLLRKNEQKLSYYRSAARQAGLAAELDSTFAEMERCGRNVGDLVALIDDLQASNQTSSLIGKLSDLRLLYEQYLAYLGHERLDPHRRLEQVLASLSGCKRLRGAAVFIDGFLELQNQEQRMIAGLAKVCSAVQITLLLDPASPVLKNPHHIPDELSLFHKTEQTYRKLFFALNEAGITPQPPLVLKEPLRFASASLRQIEAHLFTSRRPTCGDAPGLELIEAADRRAEVDAVARQIRKHVEAGLRYREIAVLMRNIDDYADLINASFIEHGIPYFVDRRRTAGHHPLIQFVRSLMQIVLHGWPNDAVMTLLKTELAGLIRHDIDELENYVLLHRVHGSAWTRAEAWQYRRRLTHGREDEQAIAEAVEIERIDAMRRNLADRIVPFERLISAQSIDVRAIVRELFATIDRFDIRTKLREWMDAADAVGHREQAGEHGQVWAEFVALLDQMVDVVGDERVTPADFESILETGLEPFDLALTPQTVDQVLVGAVDRTRSARPRAAILMGLNDSQFPRLPRESSILSDSERRTLDEHKLELDPDGQRTLLDEQLLGYIAFTRASESLCMTRAIADDESRAQTPSQFLVRLRQMFPSLEPVQIPRDARAAIESIGTPRQLVTALMQWARDAARLAARGSASVEGTAESAAASAWPSLYNWLAGYARYDDSIGTMRYRAWKALSYANTARLSPAAVARLFASPISASVSRIEAFATCPFKHFLQFGLHLEEREEQEVTAIDLGNVCHGILERIVRTMLPAGKWESLPAEQGKALIHSVAQEIGQELRGELMLSSGRNQHMLEQIERTIDQVLTAQTVAGQRGRLVPWRVELEFGEGKSVPPLVLNTPAGNVLNLRGKIDRVDLLKDESAFAVIDYKYRGNSLALDRVYHGLSLQLLTYLLVLQRNAPAGKKMTPVAAFYVQLLRQLEKVSHPDDATPVDDPAFDLKVKPRGIIDWNQRHLLDAQHQSKASEVVSLYVRADGTLGNKNTCDGCESDEFAAMLKLVERKLTELADRIIAGQVDVAPYRIGETSPCVNCGYRSVCRFDPAINRYNHLPPMKREDVLKRAIEEMEQAADGRR